MKRFALFILLCILGASVPAGLEAWRWRERKLGEDERAREQEAAENTAAGRLGLKTQPLPPHPLDRRLAIDEALRLDPDRRFLLAARELSGAEVTARFSEGRWILSAGSRELARLAESPDFAGLMKALAPLARDWVAAAKVTGKASRVRAVRGHREAFAAIRDAQAKWARGERGAGLLHEAAAAAAALVLQVPRAYDADDRLDAHAIALCAADEAAGGDVRGEQAVLALALGYAGAARALAPENEAALHAFVHLEPRKLADAARRKDANAGDRHLLFRWLVQDGDERALLRFIGSTRQEEHISIPAVGQLLPSADLQLVATASEALQSLVLAELEGVHAVAPTDLDLTRTLISAQNSALQNLARNEDFRGRLAADLRQADAGAQGPLWRAADTSAWYAAATASALLGSARSGYVLRKDPGALPDDLATWPVPAAAQMHRWVKAKLALDRGLIDEAYETLSTARLPGARAVADVVDALAGRFDPPDPRIVEAIRLARGQLDSRPPSRLVWAEMLRKHTRDLERFAQVVGGLVDEAPGAYPEAEVALARQRGEGERLERLAANEGLPFAARLNAAGALADVGANAQAERALRRLARERPGDVDTLERLMRLLHDAGRSSDAVGAGLELVRAFGDDDSFLAARARCAAARQLDAAGRHDEALAVVERALPTEAVCAYRIATVQLAHLRRKEDAENLLLAYLARHPLAETVAAGAEARWLVRDDAGAADMIAHPPVGLSRSDFRTIGERFANAFRGRPPAEAKRAVEALLQAGIQPLSLVELGPPLARAGSAAQAFELYTILSEKLPSRSLQLGAWAALRTAKGAKAAQAWLRAQPGAQQAADDELATFAYGEGLDDALWELFPDKPLDAGFAERLTLLRAASLVRRGERGPRRDALVAHLSDPLAPWKARAARYLRMPGAYASWEVRLARFVLGEGSEEEMADEASEGARPCEAPYYFGLRAAAESRARDASAWYRVALECRNPRQRELSWAYQAASRPQQDRPAPAKPLHVSR